MALTPEPPSSLPIHLCLPTFEQFVSAQHPFASVAVRTMTCVTVPTLTVAHGFRQIPQSLALQTHRLCCARITLQKVVFLPTFPARPEGEFPRGSVCQEPSPVSFFLLPLVFHACSPNEFWKLERVLNHSLGT